MSAGVRIDRIEKHKERKVDDTVERVKGCKTMCVALSTAVRIFAASIVLYTRLEKREIRRVGFL